MYSGYPGAAVLTYIWSVASQKLTFKVKYFTSIGRGRHQQLKLAMEGKKNSMGTPICFNFSSVLLTCFSITNSNLGEIAEIISLHLQVEYFGLGVAGFGHQKVV